jgi:hypothetical protein
MGISGGSNQSSSSGSAYGYNQSLAQSLSQQGVWAPQAQQLAGMYGQAGQLASAQQATVPGAAAAQSGQVMPAARFGLTQMQQFANPNSDLAQRQTAALADTVGQQFGRTILPQITSSAGLGGNIGGSREALAKGVAAGDAAQAISSGATDFFSNAYNQAATAAGALPGMASQVFNLGMAPFQAAWAPLTSLAGVLGGPTVLGQSLSRAQSAAENWQQQQASASGRQFGFNLW